MPVVRGLQVLLAREDAKEGEEPVRVVDLNKLTRKDKELIVQNALEVLGSPHRAWHVLLHCSCTGLDKMTSINVQHLESRRGHCRRAVGCPVMFAGQ